MLVKKNQIKKFWPLKIQTPTMVTKKLKDFPCKQIVHYCSNNVPYYDTEFFVQDQMAKFFSDNSLLRLHPQKLFMSKSVHTMSKSVPFILVNPSLPVDIEEPSPKPSYNRSRLPILTQETTTLEIYACKNSRQ